MSAKNGVDPADRALLLHLGQVVSEVDPPPPVLYELGRAAFETRLLGAELAALEEDTSHDLVGVRSTTSETRLVTFTASRTTIELEVSVPSDRRCLLGQIVPAPSEGNRSIDLQTAAGGRRTAELDAVGGFRFDDVPTGFVRLHFEPVDGPAVTTSWITP